MKVAAKQYIVMTSGNNYGATFCGVGASLQRAFEALRDGLDNQGEELVAPEECAFFVLGNEVQVESETVIKERK